VAFNGLQFQTMQPDDVSSVCMYILTYLDMIKVLGMNYFQANALLIDKIPETLDIHCQK